jgi:TolB-like protein/DNA-binding winged helix-turn-helix (wHTH) protein/Tfp pilus assembly protein PilF
MFGWAPAINHLQWYPAPAHYEQRMTRDPFRLGEWLIEPAIDEIVRDGTRIKIEPRTMAVLGLLAQRAPDVLSQEEIERTVWSGVVVTPHSVYQSVAQLRRLLGDDPRHPRYIATVPRKGYRLIAPVERVEHRQAILTAGEGRVEALRSAQRTGGLRRGRYASWIAVPVALVFAGLAALKLAGVWPFESTSVERPDNSIAVLPLKDLSPQGDAGPLADGIAAELVNALSQARELRVAGTTSAFSLRNDPRQPRELGRALGVRYLVEGTVSRSAERVRVSVRLVDAGQGFNVWSETYDRPFADILELQDDLARSIAGALQVLLIRSPGVGLSQRRPQSLTAYELYLLGLQSYFARTPQSLREAASYFQRAIDADPLFAAAFAGLADTYVAEYFYAGRPLDETRALATPLLDQALALDPQLVSAHGLSGLLKLESGELEAAEVDLARAIDLNANYSRAHLWLGMTRHDQLRFEEALTSFNRAVELDPLIFPPYIWRGLTFDSLGRGTLAQQEMERAVMLAPRHPNPRFSLGLNAVARGELREASQHYSQAAGLDTRRSEHLYYLAQLELELGDDSAARRHLREAATIARSGALHLNHLIWLALIDDDRARIRALAQDLATVATGDATTLAEAAFYLGLGDEPAAAVKVYEQVLAMNNGRGTMFPLTALRWGVDYHALDYATYLRSSNQADRADRVLLDLEQFLDQLERNGFRHWGLTYVRVGIAAQRGDKEIALQLLEQARALGWRRHWWSRRDPALAPLRDHPQFTKTLARARPG